jgi:alpha-tubulin suppressor-like RCC1 family protein
MNGAARTRRILWPLLLGVIACGDRTSGPPDGFTYSAVSAGGQHSCGVTPEGAAYCWGRGDRGALGHGTLGGSTLPVKVSLEVGLEAISAGQFHNCALTHAQQLVCWGGGQWGQLGLGVAIDIATPVQVVGDQPFTAVSAGWLHTCALDLQGRASCWGYNGQGQLGDGTAAHALAPVPVATDERFQSISAGADHTCAVALDGSGWCWGLNHRGQLGTGTLASSLTPTPVAGGHVLRTISAGYSHSCGVRDDRVILCWGSNEHGELGNADRTAVGVTGSMIPDRNARVAPYAEVSAGYYYTCAVTTDGRGYCWGRGADLQLGSGNVHDHTVAQPIADSDINFAGISAGGLRHTCGFSRHGGAYCWGTGEHGQLGNASVSRAPLPVRVAGALE